MKPSTSYEPLLTIDQVRAKRMEIVRGEQEIVRISERLEGARKAFQQMLVFVPEPLREQILSEDLNNAPDLFTEPAAVKPKSAAVVKKTSARPQKAKVTSSTRERNGFVALITDLVAKSRDGISHDEMKAAVKATEHANRLDDQAKAYHRTIGKLVSRGEIVRHGTKFYAASVYEVLKKNGNLPEIEEGLSLRVNGAAKITLDVLQGHPNGLSGPDLKVLVGADPSAPKSVAGHGQYIYNVLATLIGTGRVVKEGSLYRIAEKVRPRANGASVSTASGLAH